MAQDVVWVNGGSVANLLAVWRVHGLDEILRRVWTAGVVLGGVSAGSICWFDGGTTDSFGPELQAVTNGLGFLPYGNGVSGTECVEAVSEQGGKGAYIAGRDGQRAVEERLETPAPRPPDSSEYGGAASSATGQR